MTNSSQAAQLAGNLFAWSLVGTLSISMVAGAAWFAVVMYVTAADLLKKRGQ